MLLPVIPTALRGKYIVFSQLVPVAWVYIYIIEIFPIHISHHIPSLFTFKTHLVPYKLLAYSANSRNSPFPIAFCITSLLQK